jgi:uncharacterized protein involved in exopolysaccharide biosynthesis
MNPDPAISPSRLVETTGTINYVGLVWCAKWWLLLCALLGLFVGIAFLHASTPKYRATLQLVPVEQSGAAVSRNISGLASLAGINLPRGQTSQFGVLLEAIKSDDVASAVATDKQLMRRLFAKQWDTRIRSWREPADPLRDIKNVIKSVLAIPIEPWSPPGRAALQKRLKKTLVIEEDPKRPIATVMLTDPDPELARDLLAALYRNADRHLRMRMDRRTSAYVTYIARKLSQVTLAEHREALADALSEQERVLMMARSGQPFAADTLGTVAVTDKPVWPNTLVALVVGVVLGVAIGAAAVFGRDWRRRHWSAEIQD